MRDDAGADDAERFADLFPEVYLRLHARRDRAATSVTPQMWAVLQHLSLSGPLTVTEAAAHFGRAQSVVSEMVDALERKRLLERMRDARDRRRVLVWLTDEGLAFMTQRRRVLDDERLVLAMRAMDPSVRSGLVKGMQALVDACEGLRATRGVEKKRRGS
ncbi:MAG: winged helix-turn-helix transcriptional regulator [Deltaproteobacteria bacterium]|nr:winged helix-turn-helix transcriptional regulator [Deltaproteobacteria bacterium]